MNTIHTARSLALGALISLATLSHAQPATPLQQIQELYSQNNLPEVLKVSEAALSQVGLDPAQAGRIRNLRVAAYAHMRLFQHAEREISAIRKADPANTSILFDLGEILFAQGRYEEATKVYQQLLPGAAGNARSLNLLTFKLGIAQMKLGQEFTAPAAAKPAADMLAIVKEHTRNGSFNIRTASPSLSAYIQANPENLLPFYIDTLLEAAWVEPYEAAAVTAPR